MLEEARSNVGTTEVFNSDSDCQFTSEGFSVVLKHNGLKINIDSNDDGWGDVFIESLQRSWKYSEIELNLR